MVEVGAAFDVAELVAIRDRLGLSDAEFSRRIGVHRSTWSRAVRGLTRLSLASRVAATRALEGV